MNEQIIKNNTAVRADSKELHDFLLNHSEIVVTDDVSGDRIELNTRMIETLLDMLEPMRREEVVGVTVKALPDLMTVSQAARFLCTTEEDVTSYRDRGELGDDDGLLLTEDVIAKRGAMREAEKDLLLA